jgi:hypothetical protein
LVDESDWIGLGRLTLTIEAEGAELVARPHPQLDLPVDCDSPPDEALYDIDGHFDDPAASQCVSDRPSGEPRTLDPRISELRCRATFIVSALNASR